MALTRARAVAAFAAALFAVGSARAEEIAGARLSSAARDKDRPHTLFELGSGFFLLPGALVCKVANADGTCQSGNRGEFSLAFGLQNMYRIGRFGIGGGIQWATTLRTDAALGDSALQRSHSRRYFLYEAQGRYYFVASKSWDFWAGATIGGVVVNDSWSTKADREPYADTAFVGPRAATLGSEGLTLGACMGGEWSFAPNWSLGPSLRYSLWFLSAPPPSPTRDAASLSGRLDMIDVGVRVAYRLSL
jgi:hypothetical protein